MLEALSFFRRYLFSSCRWMGAEANPGKVLREVMFLSPSIALAKPFPSGADICLSLSYRYPPPLKKWYENLLQEQYLGHQAVLEAGPHPNLVSLHCCLPNRQHSLLPAAPLSLAESSPPPLQTQRPALFSSYTLQQPRTHSSLLTPSLLDVLGYSLLVSVHCSPI